MTAPSSRHGGLLRAVLTLVAGGAIAQALPLLLGPWLTRLYSPEQFGVYHLFAAVSANLAVVACARYEFALPLVGDAVDAAALRALCLRVLGGVTLASALGAAAWLAWSAHGWTAWLPVAVAVLGWLSLATLWATRAQAYRALAIARVVQYGGASLAQAGAALLGAGVQGLIVAPIAAAAAAAAVLRLPVNDAVRPSPQRWRELARRFRDFPLLNTPHAFMGALQDTVSIAMIAAWQGPVAAGFWGLSLRYLKAPATLVGGAVSQALYPQLAAHGASVDHDADAHAPLRVTREGRAAVRRVMAGLAAIAAPLVLLLWAFAPWAFERLFGPQWRGAGELARTLGLYIGVHFVAAPLAVVTLAWGAQAWALRLALVGQVAFVAALAAGLKLGGLPGAGWGVSIAMTLYFGVYFVRLATWPLTREEHA
ncbi:lipopolysaccharide biosynthesis protein [Scleromatobacter humisilvae]|uniref:Lipopolysaccharide biosynthesis protein n=1 Tax=Scleromatobacter humisilvae TaxID=2897159 RepID=A0A9X2C412_9BURK|nr:lipopolysaccharide biosynthesis protein [Scleromatobacter humisilvae]MCK9688370.1 lipopolysaccharide biosynthesis protein [Scleromatobacter humisilvae]